MTIHCLECGKEFKSMVTGRHIKSHNITTEEYKNKHNVEHVTTEEHRSNRSNRTSGENNPMYGKNHTNETKNKISKINRGKPGHNKGKPILPHVKEALNNSRRGKPAHNKGKPMSEEQKVKIRLKRKEQVITTESRKKAAATKKANGGDLAFFRGHKHSEESKKLISEKGKAVGQILREETNLVYLEKIKLYNFTLLNEINEHFLYLQCNVCKHKLYRTRQVFRDSKVNERICDNCYPRIKFQSNDELEILEHIKNMLPNTEILSGNRHILNGLELDIYIPDLNLAFEYCGLYWHSEAEGKDSKYHIHKFELCRNKGIKLITIFEDEYLHRKDIVIDRINNALGIQTNKIGARQCKIKEITSHIANRFLKENHLQSLGRSNYRIGLYFNNELVSVMTFSLENISRKVKCWEINRFCNKKSTMVIGSASKLFKFFIDTFQPNQVISYADIRWGSGKVYEQLGFKLDSKTSPNYWYIEPGSVIKRTHRYNYRMDKLPTILKERFDPNKTEWENMKAAGFNKIWDCGSFKYSWCRNIE